MRLRQTRGDAATALADAERFLEQRGTLLTPLRHAVLRLLCGERKALAAYDLVYSYQQEVGHRVAPNTIYRTLAFLQRHGVVAHLANKRYVLVTPQPGRFTLLFICGTCGSTAAHHDADVERAVRDAARAIGFVAAQRALEIAGTCRACAAGLTDELLAVDPS